MEMNYKDSSEISGSIGLLISILVCYPGLCSVKFIPNEKGLRFSYLLKTNLNSSEFEVFKGKLQTSLDVYNEFMRKKSTQLGIIKQHFLDSTLIEITCDLHSLSREEIALINDIIKQEFEPILVSDERNEMVEEEILMQEAIMEDMLESIKASIPDKSLIGYREEGKVMVFNK